MRLQVFVWRANLVGGISREGEGESSSFSCALLRGVVGMSNIYNIIKKSTCKWMLSKGIFTNHVNDLNNHCKS